MHCGWRLLKTFISAALQCRICVYVELGHLMEPNVVIGGAN